VLGNFSSAFLPVFTKKANSFGGIYPLPNLLTFPFLIACPLLLSQTIVPCLRGPPNFFYPRLPRCFPHPSLSAILVRSPDSVPHFKKSWCSAKPLPPVLLTFPLGNLMSPLIKNPWVLCRLRSLFCYGFLSRLSSLFPLHLRGTLLRAGLAPSTELANRPVSSSEMVPPVTFYTPQAFTKNSQISSNPTVRLPSPSPLFSNLSSFGFLLSSIT